MRVWVSPSPSGVRTSSTIFVGPCPLVITPKLAARGALPPPASELMGGDNELTAAAAAAATLPTAPATEGAVPAAEKGGGGSPGRPGGGGACRPCNRPCLRRVSFRCKCTVVRTWLGLGLG